jgi:RimJ/RimL family protein N-acetyltransferase
MKNWINKLKLEGKKIRLIPINKSHKAQLLNAAKDGKLWELWHTSVPSEDNIDSYIDNTLKNMKSGTDYPFVVIDKNTNAIIGSTRYYNIQSNHRRLEIGFTWYASKYQRSGVNTECKYLLLKYAFENLNCIAVQFMTNWYNLRSRTAIARLGAKQDGILRNHRINPDGSYRDTVVFSITEKEWSGVEKSLKYEMEKYNGS